ncbi:hypothetical protein R3X43_28175, partial [Salmonella enterica subsp. enterica serovar Typhimurium]
ATNCSGRQLEREALPEPRQLNAIRHDKLPDGAALIRPTKQLGRTRRYAAIRQVNHQKKTT